MTYRLKKSAEAFDVVDGKLAGRKFRHGRVYAEIPENEKHKFEKAVEKEVKKVGKSEGKPLEKSDQALKKKKEA